MPAGVFLFCREVVEAVFCVEGYVVAFWVFDSASAFFVLVYVLHAVEISLLKISAKCVEELLSWFFVYIRVAVCHAWRDTEIFVVAVLLLWREFCLDVQVDAISSAVALRLAAEYVEPCGFCYCFEGFRCLADWGIIWLFSAYAVPCRELDVDLCGKSCDLYGRFFIDWLSHVAVR